MSAPKDIPMLFCAPMVRALIAGTKTQTRRVVSKPDPKSYGGFKEMDGEVMIYKETNPTTGNHVREYAFVLNCPWQPGDVLWVRETWAVASAYDTVKPRDLSAIPRMKVAYAASGGVVGLKLRPSIFMPRWASRLSLRVQEVRIQRLQDISEEDAIAEGCFRMANGLFAGAPHKVKGTPLCCTCPRVAYESLWTSINGPESWQANPFVWVVTFERMEGLP